VVAPYEADSQLAYLYLNDKVDFVITEDSDLLAFGVTRVFFKMNLRGDGYEIDLKNLN
jgi:exonuclease-1